ncbi:MAG TPA: FG-GAP-like repeat-containing protein [Ignavibacteria bacterium]|nr:FG-GAP-like repeat-containing protein [Ignavibacteria bacterium]
MKKHLKISLFVLLFAFMATFVLSQEEKEEGPPTLLNPSDIGSINFSAQNPRNFFSLQEISTSRLDVASGLITGDNNLSYRYGNWISNVGSGQFSNTINQFYSQVYTSLNDNRYHGVISVKLRSGTKKDIVTAQSEDLRVFWNDNNTISSQQQNINVGSTYIEKGRFNHQDDYEDVIIVQSNGIKIYKNDYNGYLNTSPYSFSYNATLVKLKQIDSYNDEYVIGVNLNKDDLIFTNGGNVKIYLNDGNNGFQSSAFADINTGLNTITDIAVEDVNNDGFNDIIVVNESNLKVYLNSSGSSIDGTADYVLTNTSYLPYLPKLTINDFNKDGYNDILMVGYEGEGFLFVNDKSSSLYSSAPNQSIGYTQGWVSTGVGVDNIESADMYNTGGIALVVSYGGFIKMMNASNMNPAPPPPVIHKDVVVDGGFLRPRLILKNRDERDFNKYKIYKLDTGQVSYQYLGETSGSEYVDNTENVYVGGEVPQVSATIYYKVTMVDNSSQESDYSKQIGYTIQGNYIPDNSNEELNTMNFVKPENFFSTNYPNPFNPSTKIYYTIPKGDMVKITVYNTVGQVVDVLVNKFHSNAGAYEVNFNGSNLSSGLYFYTIEAGNFRETKKMLLIK